MGHNVHEQSFQILRPAQFPMQGAQHTVDQGSLHSRHTIFSAVLLSSPPPAVLLLSFIRHYLVFWVIPSPGDGALPLQEILYVCVRDRT